MLEHFSNALSPIVIPLSLVLIANLLSFLTFVSLLQLQNALALIVVTTGLNSKLTRLVQFLNNPVVNILTFKREILELLSFVKPVQFSNELTPIDALNTLVKIKEKMK